MKLTLANIKELKRNSDSPLLKRVCNYVIDRWSDYNDKKGIFADVLHYGCQSGIVGELIYYHDTVRFYKQYRQEINSLPYDLMNGTAKPIRRKDRTAEKRQPIPSGLAGTAPHRRAFRFGFPRCSCCRFAACAWLRRASARRTCL